MNWKRRLFSRRDTKFAAVYAIAGIFLFLIGLVGFAYAAPLLFWPLSLLCFSLVRRPSLFAWGAIFGSYTVGVAVYVVFTVTELIERGAESTIFSDGPVYFLFVAIVVAIWVGLLLSKPGELDLQVGNAPSSESLGENDRS